MLKNMLSKLHPVNLNVPLGGNQIKFGITFESPDSALDMNCFTIVVREWRKQNSPPFQYKSLLTLRIFSIYIYLF